MFLLVKNKLELKESPVIGFTLITLKSFIDIFGLVSSSWSQLLPSSCADGMDFLDSLFLSIPISHHF